MKRNLIIPSQRFTPEEQISHLRILNKRGKLSAFIGAGVSMSCGLPDWQALRTKIKHELSQKNPEISCNDEEIEDVARIEFGEEFNSVVAKILYDNDIKISNQIKLLAKSGIERFVCFNFDDLLEEVLQSEIIEHKVILNGQKFNANYNGLIVFHTHGYLERFSSKRKHRNTDIVISKKDYEKLYIDHYCLTNLIQLSVIMNNSVLFVGMSLNDPNMVRLLETSWSLGARHWHTALIRTRSTKKENKEIVKKFRSFGVEPLWIKSFLQIENILKSIRVSKKFNSSEETITSGKSKFTKARLG